MTHKRLAVLSCVLLAGACSDSTEPGPVWTIDFGTILEDGPAEVVVIPDTVDVGVPITVVVNTFGSSSCTRPAGVEITGAGTLQQTLTPRDSIVTGGNVACTDDLAPHPHPVQLTFAQAGTATILVRGYLFVTVGRQLGTLSRQVRVGS